MKVYLVGGAIRDRLLGVSNDDTENDWLVVGSTVDEMISLGYKQVGKDFPVFLDPKEHEEFALARLEKSVRPGYKGFEFNISSKVTLEEDLSRRDLTINAIAQLDGEGPLIDPFKGQKDLEDGVLRHITEAFSDDPVRVLRVARFAARFSSFGFSVASETIKLMKSMVSSGEVSALTPERVFKELNQALSYETPSQFFNILYLCGAYQKIFPTIDSLINNKFAYLDNLDTKRSIIKFAIWLINENSTNIETLCDSIKCPKKYRQLSLITSKYYNFVCNFYQQSNDKVFDFFQETDAVRRKDRFEDVVMVFDLLGVDISPVIELRDLLANIDTSRFDKGNIAMSIIREKKLIIASFLDSTK